MLYTTQLHVSPPLPLLSTAYNNSVIVCRRSTSTCHHYPLPRPLAATAVVHCCSTSPPIDYCPPPPSPAAVVCQPSSQPSSNAAAIVRRNRRPLDAPVRIEVYSVYIRGPPIPKIGDGAKLKAGTMKERLRGRPYVAPASVY